MMLEKLHQFRKLRDKGKIAGSYLFFGQKGIGKFDFAVSLLNFLEIQNLIDNMIVSPKNNSIGIDEVRAVKRFLCQKPFTSPYKGVIFDQAEKLTPESQNTLLKIVEEPPTYGLIIFIAQTPDVFLPTLFSRLTKVYFPNIIRNIEAIQSNIQGTDLEKLIWKKILFLRKDIYKNHKKISWLLQKDFLLKKLNLNQKLQERVIQNI